MASKAPCAIGEKDVLCLPGLAEEREIRGPFLLVWIGTDRLGECLEVRHRYRDERGETVRLMAGEPPRHTGAPIVPDQVKGTELQVFGHRQNILGQELDRVVLHGRGPRPRRITPLEWRHDPDTVAGEDLRDGPPLVR